MLKQNLNFKLSQKLSPQQIQLMKLIQLPTQAFEQKLAQEIDENSALENGKEETKEVEDYKSDDTQDNNEKEINIDDYITDDDTPYYKTQVNNFSADDEDKNIPYAGGKSFHQHLKGQLNTFD